LSRRSRSMIPWLGLRSVLLTYNLRKAGQGLKQFEIE
jgi:hypothetical protein